VNGRRSFDYPEISGYALTYLAGLESMEKHELVAGHRAAEWLIARVRGGNLAARDGWDNDAIYLFDLGMIASGLLSFGRRTGVERYLETGSLLVSILEAEASSGDMISPVSRQGPKSRRTDWSARGVSHLAKLVQPFLLAEESGGGSSRSVSSRLIEQVRRNQDADGRIWTDEDRLTTMLHPHLYAAEGLWIWGSAVGDDDALERARAAVEWAWSHQLGHGGLPRSVTHTDEDEIRAEQSDVTAQAIRLSLAMGARSSAVGCAIKRMVGVARRHRSGLGIVYQPGSSRVHLNMWATLFAVQALTMAVPEAPQISWQELV
jgi:hypothetical protein